VRTVRVCAAASLNKQATYMGIASLVSQVSSRSSIYNNNTYSENKKSLYKLCTLHGYVYMA
jgi:uncharacterized membrane protein